MKQCTKCGELRPLEQFVRDKRRPDGRAAACKPCANAAYRKNYQRNLESNRAKKRAYNNTKRDAIRTANRQRMRKWRETNPERARKANTEASRKLRATNPDYYRLYYLANIEVFRERARLQQRQVRRERPDLERDRKRRYRQNNADAIRKREREKTLARRAKQPYSRDLAEFMAALVEQPCAYCSTTQNITIDHVVPLSRGGLHEANNLAPACFSCNSSKCDRLLSEWNGRVAA